MNRPENILIAEHYHCRTLHSASISMDGQICKCCGKTVYYTRNIEHDSQDYSKDLSICIDCYVKITNYWRENKPRKISF